MSSNTFTISGPSGKVIFRHWSLWNALDFLVSIVMKYPQHTFTFK